MDGENTTQLVRRMDERLQMLSDSDIAIVEQIFNAKQPPTINISYFPTFEIRLDELKQRLSLNYWLNDNIVDGYVELLQTYDNERCLRDSSRVPSYILPTSFYRQLAPKKQLYNYRSVQFFFSKKHINIMEKGKLFIPVNVDENHWVFVVVFIAEKTIRYYDSLYNNTRFNMVVNNIKQYMFDSTLDQTWEIQSDHHRVVPQQQNSHDCGVFMCMMMDALLDEIPLHHIKQTDMQFYRKKMCADLVRCRLLYSLY